MKHPLRLLWLFALAGVLVGVAVTWIRRDDAVHATPAALSQQQQQTSPTTTPGTDWTAQLHSENPNADWLAAVVSATSQSDGSVLVATTIVGPHDSEGSPASQQAMAVCNAAAAMLQPSTAAARIVVAEADGTTIAAYGLHLAPDRCVTL